MNSSDDFLSSLDWRLVVSPEEIEQARIDWLAARDGDEDVPAERVAALFEYYRALISLEAQQIAEEFRAGHRAF